MLALDVARIEAGLILLDVDYLSATKALIPAQQYSPFEIGLGRLVHLDKAPFIGQRALRREAKRGPAAPARRAGGRLDGPRAAAREVGLPPQLPLTASRVSVPVFRDGAQVGKATEHAPGPRR